jgi:uncharacterized membrane protein
MLVRRKSVARVGPIGLEHEWLLKRNAAMSQRQLVIFYLSLVAVSLLIAGGLALSGAWMVLPFCGIDLLAVGAALVIFARRAGDHERVLLAGGELIVEVVAAGKKSVILLNRHWVRVETEYRRGFRLVLLAQGRRHQVGRFVGEDERREFARELTSALARD